MRHLMILFVLLVAILAVVSPAAAQPNPGNPEPGTPADNLCYEGGAWDDGRCDIPPHNGATNLAWVCGWYMARYYAGIFSASQVIPECQHYLKVDEPVKDDPCLYSKPGSGVSAAYGCCFPFKPFGTLSLPYSCCPGKPVNAVVFGEPRRFAC